MKHILHLTAVLLFSTTAFTQTSNKELRQRLKQQKQFVKERPFVYIPSGSFNMGVSDQDAVHPGQIRPRTVDIDHFYMMQCEVSNFQYLEYIDNVQKTDSLKVQLLLPDTLVWRKSKGFNDVYTDYYLRHPAYSSYPVVGVSYNQAVRFAEWMTEQYNNRPDDKKAFTKVKFRLPTEEEWEYAARGGLDYSNYPWGGPYMHNSEGMKLANMSYVTQSSVYRDTVWVRNPEAANDTTQAEFIPQIGIMSTGMGDYMGVAGNLNDAADITAPVQSYWPNGYGLYHMTGNVEEMVDAHYNRENEPYTFTHDSNQTKAKDPSGVTRGGSWRDTGYYGQISVRQFYDGKDSASSEIGFRLVMEVLEY